MTFFYVIRQLSDNLYYRSNYMFTLIDSATRFDSYETALAKLDQHNSLGFFQIDKIYIK